MLKCVNTLNGVFFRYNRLYTLDRLFWKVSGNEWRDNTENGRIEKNSTDEKQPAEVNDWGGDDFVAKEEPAAETGEEGSASKGMSAEQETAAALAVAAAGAAAATGKDPKGAKAAKKTKQAVKKLPTKSQHIDIPVLPKGTQWEKNVLNSFEAGKATQTTYKGGTVLYRVGGKNGGFWTLEPPPATEYQWRVNYAIKQEFCNDASTVYKITVPEGSSLGVLEGKVGTQGMGLYGGAHQAYIDYRKVPSDWIEIAEAEWK